MWKPFEEITDKHRYYARLLSTNTTDLRYTNTLDVKPRSSAKLKNKTHGDIKLLLYKGFKVIYAAADEIYITSACHLN